MTTMFAADVRIVARTALPTRWGTFTTLAFRYGDDPHDHLALVAGEVEGADDDVLVRIHSECLTGEVLGSLKCDCGDQLEGALELIAAAGRGVLVYLRGHEGRGIGLAEKLRAYELQESGLDTVDANLALGHPVDARDFRPAAAVLRLLGVRRVALLTNNGDKAGVLPPGMLGRVVPMPTVANPHNEGYLRTKRERLGHSGLVSLPPTGTEGRRPLTGR